MLLASEMNTKNISQTFTLACAHAVIFTLWKVYINLFISHKSVFVCVYKILYSECEYDFLESCRLHLESLHPKSKCCSDESLFNQHLGA